MSSNDRPTPPLPHGISYLFDAIAVLAFCFGLVVLGAGLGNRTVPVSMLVGGVAPLVLGCTHLYHRLREGRPEESGWDTSSSTDEATEDPLSILKTRYARGEIDSEEFERRVDGLLAAEAGQTDREEVVDHARH